MGTLPENPDNYPVAVTQLETTDLVKGGADGASNKPLKDLADRTANLNKRFTGHKHDMTEVNGLAAALNDKTSTGHKHEIADVNGLASAMSGKSDSGHRHNTDTVPTIDELTFRSIVSLAFNFNNGVQTGYCLFDGKDSPTNGPAGEQFAKGLLVIYAVGEVVQMLYGKPQSAPTTVKRFIRFGNGVTKVFDPWIAL